MQVTAPISIDLGGQQVIRHPFGTLHALHRSTQLGPRELAVDHAQVIGAGRQSLTQLCHPLQDPARRCFLSRSEGLFCAPRGNLSSPENGWRKVEQIRPAACTRYLLIKSICFFSSPSSGS